MQSEMACIGRIGMSAGRRGSWEVGKLLTRLHWQCVGCAGVYACERVKWVDSSMMCLPRARGAALPLGGLPATSCEYGTVSRLLPLPAQGGCCN